MSESWSWAGERALLRRFDDADGGRANARALALWRRLDGASLPEVEDAIPGARTLLVVLIPGAEPGERLRALLEEELTPEEETAGALREIGVTYDGEDLKTVAELNGLKAAEVIELHATPEYRVGFVGFSPGFGYLLGLPAALHTPRLDTPRTRVPAGSVAIGGEFTGVYPRATPGGWRLIGRTDAPLFDPARDPAGLLHPGDRVRFVPR